MLMPKKTKYRKVQKGRKFGRSKGARTVFFGEYGLQAVEPVWLTAQQIEAVRVTVSRKLKKVGKLFLRVFPDKPVTKKPAETRMGKGKGNPELWVAVVKRDRVIFEISGMPEVEARQILRAAAYKLPMKTRFVSKAQEESASVQTPSPQAE
ncbi:50S ribosomal protein L16 [Vermiphilus pyriformis]|jgi:large subunit ribosomal protein L16|uniref:Large ribosomal subunit protein uL16 n=1 Tax=candidate division TM6 bacterium JCVI TM6SC1 TaxID=1306947 RepID=A0A0D2K4Z0_9BACT|nr:50S ribosomal protein L16 [candidate division TM6 bacterium JCVI TM6SC1]UNE35370.1 MAG: 50S ribosomal protein L16 [Vermiphilus pyriformis]